MVSYRVSLLPTHAMREKLRKDVLESLLALTNQDRQLHKEVVQSACEHAESRPPYCLFKCLVITTTHSCSDIKRGELTGHCKNRQEVSYTHSSHSSSWLCGIFFSIFQLIVLVSHTLLYSLMLKLSKATVATGSACSRINSGTFMS